VPLAVGVKMGVGDSALVGVGLNLRVGVKVGVDVTGGGLQLIKPAKAAADSESSAEATFG
jgi:hypothetical protein